MQKKIGGALLNQNGISELKDLIGLDDGYNSKIKNINHLTNLKVLYSFGICGI